MSKIALMKKDVKDGFCCFCGEKYDEYDGNNPYPLITEDDADSRCCWRCFERLVIPARYFMLKDSI